ncbi:MAG TPA: PNGase F N-terminal domain-containing protein, partial [Polyangiaceae bacterium]|nr:PNGase F N-terminal domain-containing protein [Polyangiaceae bacterium]
MLRPLVESRGLWLLVAGLALACASSGSPSSQLAVGTGGAGTGGGTHAAGGSSGVSAGGAPSSGGASSSGGGSSGGQAMTGGAESTETGGAPQGPTEFSVFEEVVFYDGYASVMDDTLPPGATRIDNSLVTTKLTDERLALIQSHLELEVTIFARCDNYDRIGSVSLALAEKGAKQYDPSSTPHLEVGRFITPFMDKNREPTSVDYKWSIDQIAAILRSPALRAKYDFWLEFSVFGVPYAANEEVAGCAGRSDVFAGSVALRSDSSAPESDADVVLPLAFNAPFNDYQAGASDALGTTKKTLSFSLDEEVEDTQIVLIVSHHGANSGGEEYIRREHSVSLDDEAVLEFRPGRSSCEPFRAVNTQ